MGTILLTMMFFKDNFVATAFKTIAKLCGRTPRARHDARLHLHQDAREPYPANDLSAKDDSLVFCGVGFFSFVVYAQSKWGTRTSMRSMQK